MKRLFTTFFFITLFYVSFFIPVHAHAADYYFTHNGSSSWSSGSNWWLDSNHSIPAGTPPTSTDNAYIDDDVSIPVNTTVANLYVGSSGITNILVSLVGNFTANEVVLGSSHSIRSTGTIVGSSYTLHGNVTLYNSSMIEFGTVDGNVTAHDSGSIHNMNDVTGTINIYDGGSVTASTISGTTYFHDNSFTGDVTYNGDVYFNGGQPSILSTTVFNASKYRYYDSTSSSLNAALDFTSYAPWTIVADGVTIDVRTSTRNLDETSASRTSFSEINGGTIIGKPVAPTLGATSVLGTSMTSTTFQTSVTNDNYASTTRRGFEYGLTSSYGSMVSTSGIFDIGNFTLQATDLSCGAAYHYRSFAHNYAGTTTSQDDIFVAEGCSSSGSGSSGGGSGYVPVLNPEPIRAVAIEASVTLPATTSAATSTLAFSRDLRVGSTGDDVKLLQQYLNAKGFVVAQMGPGSLGNETTTFGPRTRAALAHFQTSQAIMPAAGFFGPITRAYINSHQ